VFSQQHRFNGHFWSVGCPLDFLTPFIPRRRILINLDTFRPSLPRMNPLTRFHPPSSYSIWPSRHQPYVQHVQTVTSNISDFYW